MKLILAVLCLMSIQMVKSEKKEVYNPTCMKETGTTEESINKGKSVYSRDYLCYTACTWKQHKIMTANNRIDTDFLNKTYNSGNRPIPVSTQEFIIEADICNRLVTPDPDMCIAYNETFFCMVQVKGQINEATAIKQFCMKHIGTTQEQFVAYGKPGVDRSRGFLCYFACVYRQFDIWESGNQMNIEKVLQERNITDTVRNTKLTEISKECNLQVKPDDESCLAFNQTVNCIKLKDENGFDILSETYHHSLTNIVPV